MTYSAEERASFDPGPCPKCGGTDVEVEWVDASTSFEPDGYLPGTFRCLNTLCPSNAPIRWFVGRVN